MLDREGNRMERKFTLEYWIDDDWYVGRLREVPSVFSQGATLAELEENIQDAYRMMTEDTSVSLPSVEIREKEVSLQV
jgi:predicted RNase H-like HicB family nuclease